ncbi:MAG: PQQ-dependent sugar dehydrogenase [Planctomycetaceae bacterium]
MSRGAFGVVAKTLCGLMLSSALGEVPMLSAGAPEQTGSKKPVGIEKRTLWTTSQFVGTPDPPHPYRLEVAFPTLTFSEPLSMGIVPGTDRLAIAERKGKIYTFRNDRNGATKELLVDVGRTVYGVAFHPKFAENGLFFVTSVPESMLLSTPDGSYLSRFQAKVEKDKAPRAEASGEQIILKWPAGGHNGGCIRFGPDGYLYLATGDGSGIADEFQTGQDLGDLLGAIHRIDVDHEADGKLYAIPPDNPFVNTAGARPENWSFGHRQVWKFSFNTADGKLWAGEVGQDLWEMIYIVQKGGNYGWSVQEGAHPFRPERKKGPGAIIPPIIEQPHSDFRSITGGYVSHAERVPELKGTYIYGDYDTGRVWGFRYDNGKVLDHRELVDTQFRLVEFGQDTSGDVYLVDFVGGQIHRLAPAPKQATPEKPFPKKLSETGLFASTKDHTPAPGVIPYSVNAPLWSDGAAKDRFLALPGDSKIEFEAVTYPQPAPGSSPGWRFPDGTVLVKTFSIETEAGNPKSQRRLETRVLHYKQMPGNDDEYGAQLWYGYTYLWNDEQTDAELLDTRGLDREYFIKDAKAPGGQRKQKWHFPSRSECTLCHTMAAKYVLGITTLQMNKDHDYGEVTANQLRTFDHIGLFTKPLPAEPETMEKLADYHDKSASVDVRARSYLHANCSHCHRKWGGGNAEFQLLATLPITETGTVDVKPGQGAFGLANARYIAPGDPTRSMVYHRMTLTGLGRMPHVAVNIIDQEAVDLIREWIRQMPAKP